MKAVVLKRMPPRRRPYGLGQSARTARMIAVQLAEELRCTDLAGPHAREAILGAALLCPLVRTRAQAQAVVDGWEGKWKGQTSTNPDVGVCHSAGRQLASLKGVLS